MSREEVLALYLSGPDALEAALNGLSESDFDSSYAPGTWTIRQIVHHLADGDAVWSVGIRMALGAPGVTFRLDWYPGNEAWADTLDYARRAVEPAVAFFRAHRLYIAQLLKHFPNAWDRYVTMADPEDQQGQPMSVSTMVGLLTGHVTEHVEEIRKIREKQGI